MTVPFQGLESTAYRLRSTIRMIQKNPTDVNWRLWDFSLSVSVGQFVTFTVYFQLLILHVSRETFW